MNTKALLYTVAFFIIVPVVATMFTYLASMVSEAQSVSLFFFTLFALLFWVVYDCIRTLIKHGLIK